MQLLQFPGCFLFSSSGFAHCLLDTLMFQLSLWLVSKCALYVMICFCFLPNWNFDSFLLDSYWFLMYPPMLTAALVWTEVNRTNTTRPGMGISSNKDLVHLMSCYCRGSPYSCTWCMMVEGLKLLALGWCRSVFLVPEFSTWWLEVQFGFWFQVGKIADLKNQWILIWCYCWPVWSLSIYPLFLFMCSCRLQKLFWLWLQLHTYPSMSS